MRRHTEYENMVAAYDGLSPTERREIDAHLAECAVCAAELAAYRQMDGAIRSVRALKASAGLRVRFSGAISGAMSGATAAPAPEVVRPKAREPVIRQARRPRQPWTWSRALVPVGFLLLFAIVMALSLPPNGTNTANEVLQPQVRQPMVAPTPFPEARPLPGVPNRASGLVQTVDENEEDFLARIAATDIFTGSSALLVLYTPPRSDAAWFEELMNPDSAVRCWVLKDGKFTPCPAQPVEQVLAAQPDPNETIVRFVVTFYRLYDKVVMYEVETNGAAGMQKQAYQVILREENRQWRETTVQATSVLKRPGDILPEREIVTPTLASNAAPFIGIPNTSAHLIQNDGESLLDFMARIGADEVDDWPREALIVESAIESRDNLYQGVSPQQSKHCWSGSDAEAQLCYSGKVVEAVAAARDAGRRIVYFAVASADASEILILYDVHYVSRPNDLIDGYRVIIRLVNEKWREESLQQMY